MQRYIMKIEYNNNQMELLARNQRMLLLQLERIIVHIPPCSPFTPELSSNCQHYYFLSKESYSLEQSTVSLMTFGDFEVLFIINQSCSGILLTHFSLAGFFRWAQSCTLLWERRRG